MAYTPSCPHRPTSPTCRTPCLQQLFIWIVTMTTASLLVQTHASITVPPLQVPCCAGSLMFTCQRQYMKCAVSLNGTVLQCIQNGGDHQWQIGKTQTTYSEFRASVNSFFTNADVNVKGGTVNDNMVNILQCSTAALENNFRIRNYPVAALPPNFQTACKGVFAVRTPLDCIGVKKSNPNVTNNVYFSNSSLSISNLSLVNNVLQLEFSLRLGAPLPSHRRHAVRAYLLDSAGYFAKDNSTWSADPSSGNQLAVISDEEVVGKVLMPLNAINATNTTTSFLLQLGFWTETSVVELLMELSIVDSEVFVFPSNDSRPVTNASATDANVTTTTSLTQTRPVSTISADKESMTAPSSSSASSSPFSSSSSSPTEGPPDVEPNTGLSDSTLIAIIVTTLVVVLAIFALVVIFVMRGHTRTKTKVTQYNVSAPYTVPPGQSPSIGTSSSESEGSLNMCTAPIQDTDQTQDATTRAVQQGAGTAEAGKGQGELVSGV